MMILLRLERPNTDHMQEAFIGTKATRFRDGVRRRFRAISDVPHAFDRRC